MGLGLASFVMNITESLINIAFNASLSKYGGDVAVGAMTILASIMQLQFMPVQGLGQAKLSLFIACLRKIILLLPLIYLMPMFIENKVFAVFLAEPVSDFISVAVASTLFLCNIKKILAKA